MRRPRRGAVAVWLGCLVAAGAGATGADATFPGPNGQITFRTNAGLCAIPSAGGTATRTSATGGAQDAFSAVYDWSPDGSKLALSAPGSVASSIHIYVENADGSGLQELTHESRISEYPAWSPDGSKLVFQGDNQLSVVNADGSGERHLVVPFEDIGPTPGPGGGPPPTTQPVLGSVPRWSPDGAKIVYEGVSAPNVPSGVAVVDANEASPPRPLAPGGSGPDWSPDGGRIVYMTDRDGASLATMNADGSGQAEIPGTRRAQSESLFPAWSPDGSRIAYARGTLTANGLEYTLLTITPDGGYPRSLYQGLNLEGPGWPRWTGGVPTGARCSSGPGDSRGGSDTTAPVIRSASASPKTFVVDTGGRAEAPTMAVMSKRAQRGTKLRYTVTERGRAIFKVERRSAGRTAGRRCTKPTRNNRKRTRCVRYALAGRFALEAAAGANHHHFTGRIGKTRLKPGNYRVTVVARDTANNQSAAKRFNIRIVNAPVRIRT
jgi:dipeptidyl aminopeptidase/acylaminoacyl peptidase